MTMVLEPPPYFCLKDIKIKKNSGRSRVIILKAWFHDAADVGIGVVPKSSAAAYTEVGHF